MSKYDVDFFVIGAGSGGVRAARMSAQFGAKVAIAENKYLGGTCVNVGCVPKKLLVYASHFSDDFEGARGFGWDVGSYSFNWNRLIANKDTEIKRLNEIYKRLLDNAGVEIIIGKATIKDNHTILINDKVITADKILIATGGWPYIPEIPGNEQIITSNDAFYLEILPQSIIITGGGYIAVEFAGIFNGLGVDTTLVYRGPMFMRGFDDEVRHILAEEMRKKGIKLIFDNTIEKIEKDGNGFISYLSDHEQLSSQLILYATGRLPNTGPIGLENVGIEVDKNGAIPVNDSFQTHCESIYAIGDVTNRLNLTPVAIAEGTALAKTLFNKQPISVNYDNVPTCVFSQPNLGSVGLTEQQARLQHPNIKIFKSHFTPMKCNLSGSNEKSFMKLIVDADTDKVVGVHMLGMDAGEILQGIGIAINSGVTKAQFDSTIGIHPTSAEEFVTMRDFST